MGEVRTYDSKRIHMIVGGVPMSGFSPDTMVKATRDSDTFAKKKGVDGVVTRSHLHDRSGEFTFSLDQSSPCNDILSALAKLDEETDGGIVPILVKDSLPSSGSIGSTLVAAKAWIRKWPDVEYGKEATNRDWIFDVADYEVYLGGNLAG
jgi:hypothetical protein